MQRNHLCPVCQRQRMRVGVHHAAHHDRIGAGEIAQPLRNDIGKADQCIDIFDFVATLRQRRHGGPQFAQAVGYDEDFLPGHSHLNGFQAVTR